MKITKQVLAMMVLSGLLLSLVSLAAYSKGLPWHATVKQHAWQQVKGGKNSLRIMFDNHRYFIIAGKNNLVNQGKVKLLKSTTGFFLYNRYGRGHIIVRNVTNKGFTAKGVFKTRFSKTNFSGRFVVSKVRLAPPTAKNIYDAAKYGDMPRIQHFLKKGVKVDGSASAKRTPLAVAIIYHHSRVAKYLISKGAKLNRKTKAGLPPLALAVRSSDVESAKMLIKAGANTDFKNKRGTSLLFSALERDSLPMVKLLVKSGLSVKIQDNDGHTSLHRAMSVFALAKSKVQERIEFTKYFIEKAGFDPKTLDRHGRNVLFYAANLGLRETVTYLVAKGVSPHIKDKKGKDVFQYIKGSEYQYYIVPILKKAKK